MPYEEHEAGGMAIDAGHKRPGPGLMGASTLIGDPVQNLRIEYLAVVKEVMLDMRTGKIAFAILASGSIFSLDQTLFAVPWEALVHDTVLNRFMLDIDKERFEQAPGFDMRHWPNMMDPHWAEQIHRFYGIAPK
ncbi:MAG: PRC-barrel domain-containing protein [Pseudomonadota bacterium]